MKITGKIREQETSTGVPNLVVKAFDKDLLFDDLLGAVTTDKNGNFEIIYEGEDYKELFEKRPDIYLKIKTPDRKRTIHTTEDKVRFEADKEEHFVVDIPRETLGDSAPYEGKAIVEEVKEMVMKKISKEDRDKKLFYIDEKIWRSGEVLVVGHNKHEIKSDSVMAFIDEEPNMNWAHPCRYLFFDVKTKDVTEIPEQFPPSLTKLPVTMNIISKPRVKTELELIEERKKIRSEIKKKFKIDASFQIERARKFFNNNGSTAGCDKRWAILFSGSTNKRHINDLEFMYRTLINTYVYDQDHIIVLNYDGNEAASDWTWNDKYADGSEYMIKDYINGAGNRNDLINALNTVGPLLDAESTLFIMTNNHGGECYLCTYSGADFSATDMANCLSAMPQFKELLVAMEQCHSGCFIDPVINNSNASQTSIATACRADEGSTAFPFVFDEWALDWITAVNGEGPTPGYPLEQDPDYNNDGGISAYSAFAYSITWKNPVDTPQYKDNPPDCGQMMYIGKPDVFIRDALDDDGTEPYTGTPWWESPDIWILDEDGNPLGDAPIGGEWVQVWARVRNIGCAPAKNVHIRYYAFPIGIGATEPALIGLKVVPEINIGESVERVVWWFVPPWYGWSCARIKADCCLDPTKGPVGIWEDIWQDNNQAQLNLHVQSPEPGGWSGVWIDVENPFNDEMKFTIEVEEMMQTKSLEALHPRGKIKPIIEKLEDNVITLKPKEKRRLFVKLDVPDDISIGHESRFNIFAKAEDGRVIGGVVVNAKVSTANFALNVEDETKKPLSGASVTLKPLHHGNEYSVRTDSEGICILKGISPGKYNIIIDKKGLKTITKTVRIKPFETMDQRAVMTPEKVERWWVSEELSKK